MSRGLNSPSYPSISFEPVLVVVNARPSQRVDALTIVLHPHHNALAIRRFEEPRRLTCSGREFRDGPDDACVTLAGLARLVCKEAAISGESAMSVSDIAKRFSDAGVTVPGKKVKFDFGDEGKVFLDGVAGAVSQEDAAADTTLKIKLEDFMAMAEGKLDPTAAFMQGKLRVDGDMGVAMQLQGVMAKLRT